MKGLYVFLTLTINIPAHYNGSTLLFQVMRQLSNKVSIVPIIAKSDCLTKAEIGSLKQKILQEIRENDIRIYSLPDSDR